MTKSLNLVLEDCYYKIDNGGKRKIPVICSAAINYALHATPDKITLTVSTEQLEPSIQVFVTKNGFYRWYYHWKGFPIYGGVPSYEGEEILNKLFPDAKENGQDQPHPLWLQIK